MSNFLENSIFYRKRENVEGTIELALFLDSAAYSILTSVLNHQELVDVTFSVINQVQALYRLPSLASALSIQFSISTLEIQLRAPLDLPNFAGQQYDLLESFCNYQFLRNTQSTLHSGKFSPFSLNVKPNSHLLNTCISVAHLLS